MSIILFANNARSTLAGAINSVALSCNLSPGSGVLFPSPGAGEYFIMTFVDAATGLQNEIVHVTNRTGDNLTIIRAQEGTVAQSWQAGDITALLVTAGTMQQLIQNAQLNPVRTITASGAFVTTTADKSIGLDRVSALAPSSTTLPDAATEGQEFCYEDLSSNFQAYPLTVNAPAGMNISNAASIVLNVNKQCAYFKYYGNNTWSVKV